MPAILAAFVIGWMLQTPPASAPDEAPSGEPAVTVVPENGQRVPCDLARGKPVVQARVNGRGPFRMFVDTGAGGVVLNRDLADELKLKSTGKTRIGDPSNPQAIAADRVAVDSISVGDASFSELVAVSWDRSALYAGADAPRGVLGFPLFRGCLLTFDYGRDELRLEVGALPPADGGQIVEFSIAEGGIPGIEVQLAGRRLRATIDTGAMSGIAVNEALAAQLKWIEPPVVVGRGRTVNSEFEVKRGRIDGALRIGALELQSPEVSINPVVKEVNLGTTFLRSFAVTFDQQRRRVRFQPIGGASTAGAATADAGSASAGQGATSSRPVALRGPSPTGRPRIGIALTRRSGANGAELTISQVLSGSSAEKAGLHSGDVLQALNGRKIADLPEADVHRMMTSGEPVTFEVLRGVQTLTMTVKPL